jgi:aspartate/methionine/tyrosine aminotransferase
VVGPPSIVGRVVAAHQYVVTCAPSVSQEAAVAALDARGEVERRRHVERFRSRRELMARELRAVGGVRFDEPDGAFFFFVDVSRFGRSLDVARRVLDRRNVVTAPGVAFGEGGEGYLRLSFAASEDDIVRGVRAIGEELAC